MTVSVAQLRAARALLGWSREDLSKRSGIAPRTLARLEGPDAEPHAATISAVINALESAGVEFIPENGGGAGVRMRQPSAQGQMVPVSASDTRVRAIRFDEDRLTVELMNGRNITVPLT